MSKNKSTNIFPKPILKWVGGKTQLLDKLITEFPLKINNYHEIFLGGGSVLLALLTNVKNGVITIDKNIYAYDFNEPLIYIYKNIQSNHIELYNKIQEIINEFNECIDDGDTVDKSTFRNAKTLEEAKLSKENYYYWTRLQYNKLSSIEKKTILGSAMFIFLNKTCFRGVFRLNSSGENNVPYGHYKNPEIINKKHLEEIHNLIQGVIFESRDFTESLKNIRKNDYIYLDPPYNKETDTSFVGYTPNGFGVDIHKNLFKICNELKDKNIKFTMSNSNTELVNESFPKDIYNIQVIKARRTINSKNPEATTEEVIIKNY